MKVDPTHGPIVETYLGDLERVVRKVMAGEITSRGTAVRYA